MAPGRGLDRIRHALIQAEIDRDEVIAAARAAFAGDERQSIVSGLESVAHALGREFGVDLKPSVRILALSHKVYRAAYQLRVRGGGELTLVRLRLPSHKTMILAHLSEEPDRPATPDHDRVVGALAFVDFSRLFHHRSRRAPMPQESDAAARRGH